MGQTAIPPELMAQVEQLSTDEKYELIEFTIQSLRHEQRQDPQLPWAAFLEHTFGILADDPIERAPQGEPEVREKMR